MCRRDEVGELFDWFPMIQTMIERRIRRDVVVGGGIGPYAMVNVVHDAVSLSSFFSFYETSFG